MDLKIRRYMIHLSKVKYLNEISVSKCDLDPFLRCQIYVHQGIQLSVNSHELGIPENRRRGSSWASPSGKKASVAMKRK